MVNWYTNITLKLSIIGTGRNLGLRMLLHNNLKTFNKENQCEKNSVKLFVYICTNIYHNNSSKTLKRGEIKLGR